jgi:hypothetical protein
MRETGFIPSSAKAPQTAHDPMMARAAMHEADGLLPISLAQLGGNRVFLGLLGRQGTCATCGGKTGGAKCHACQEDERETALSRRRTGRQIDSGVVNDRRQADATTESAPARAASEGPSTATEPAAPTTESAPPATTASGAEGPAAQGGPLPTLIVEDETETVDSGQIRKSEFLDLLRPAVCAAVDEGLAGTGRNSDGCPHVEYWFGFLAEKSARYVERGIRRFAPEVSGAGSAAELIPAIADRVRQSSETWARTGVVEGVPGEFVAAVAAGELPALNGEEQLGGDSPVEGPSSTAAAGTEAGGADGGTSSPERQNGRGHHDDPNGVRERLGDGRPLTGSVRARMESAFGMGFGDVRVHDDSVGSQLSDGFQARAFTVGEHVAFGAGEYRPGTLVGDALIAHELAHVVQQRRGAPSSQPSRQHPGADSAFEADADRSAAGAVAAMWQGAKAGMSNVGRNVMPRLTSGLSLQRCSKTQKAKFKEFAPCTAFDDSTVPSSLMVPKPGNNKVKLEMEGSVDLAIKDPAIASVAPANSSSSPQTVTITGVAKGDTTLEAKKAGGTEVLDTVKVWVKERKDKTLAVHGITDTANAPNLVPANVADAAALQTYLNDTTWGKQANVFFTVTRSDKNAAYDLDGNKKMADPVLVSATSAEINVISGAAKAGTDFNMYFINEMEVPHAFTIPSQAETWIQDTHVNSTENVAAHELGHALGIGGESNNADDVMLGHGAASNPCRIRESDWNTVNP